MESSSLIHGSTLGSKNFQYQAPFGLVQGQKNTTLAYKVPCTAAINKRIGSAYVCPISKIRENLLQHPSRPLPPPKSLTVPNHKSIGEIASESLGFIVLLCVVSKRPGLFAIWCCCSSDGARPQCRRKLGGPGWSGVEKLNVED